MRASTPLEERLLALAEPVAADLGLRIVRVRLMGLKRKRLQIMAERVSDGGMGVEECEALSRALSPTLDAEDPIPGEYDLEVSSPGIDRPLVSPEDFGRFQGYEAKLETREAIAGRRKFRGVILALEGESVRFRPVEGEDVTLPVAGLSEARLVLTDALMADALKRAEAEERAATADQSPPVADKRTKA